MREGLDAIKYTLFVRKQDMRSLDLFLECNTIPVVIDFLQVQIIFGTGQVTAKKFLGNMLPRTLKHSLTRRL